MQRHFLRHLLLFLVITIGALAVHQSVEAKTLSFRPLHSPNAATIIVPAEMGLQAAINAVPDGGIIEIQGGTYPAPSGGFSISNLGKGFTIRAAEGQTVILDGQGVRDVIRFVNSSVSSGGPVVFENLTIQNGKSTTVLVGGGVTVVEAEATFIGCNFVNNKGNQTNFGGGGAVVWNNSKAFFFDSTFSGNSAMYWGGGMGVGMNSQVYVHNSYFLNNRTNLPNHDSKSAGGGIHIYDSKVYITNSRFEGNQAGYVGGALYALGSWSTPYSNPHSELIVSNSTFINNKAVRDPSVSSGLPTEGGAVHVEDQSVGKIYNSRFVTNSADNGGGLNIYRANTEVYDSVFLGNKVTGSGPSRGFGGAIAVISNDTSADGPNYPSSVVTIKRTFVQGRYGSTGTVGQTAGGFYFSGDNNRMYGQNGVSKNGTLAQNRAYAVLDEVLVFDTDVVEAGGVPGSGVAGGLMTDLADLAMTNSIIMGADAIGGSNGSGGGIALVNNSVGNIDHVTLAKNTAGNFGGAVFGQGSTLNLTNSTLIENEVSPGVQESIYQSYGAAVFTAPDYGRALAMLGKVENCVISNNIGMSIFEGDGNTPTNYNDMRYNSNQFYSTFVTQPVMAIFSNTLGYWTRAVDNSTNGDGLNVLTITRSNAPDTDKSQSPNSELASAAVIGDILAVPSSVLPQAAYGDPGGNTTSYVGYAWSGGSATVNGASVGGQMGLSATTSQGSWNLKVNGGLQGDDSISLGPVPAADFSANGSNLAWNLTAGSFLTAAIDQSAGTGLPASGSVPNPTAADRVYNFYALTQQGGVWESLNTGLPILDAPSSIGVLVGKNLPQNKAVFVIGNAGGSTMTWTAQSDSPGLFTVDTPSGQTQGEAQIVLTVLASSLSPGDYSGTVTVNAGAAGTKVVTVNIKVVQNLQTIFLPVTKK